MSTTARLEDGVLAGFQGIVRDVTADRRLADRAALLVQITPIHFGLGLLVAPDGPLLFFWMITALAAWRAWSRMDGARAGLTPLRCPRWRSAPGPSRSAGD